MINEIGAAPRGYLAAFARLLEQVEITTDRGERLDLDDAVDALVDSILSIKDSNAKILLIGNGGSAAIVSHTQNDLCKMVGVRAMVFTEGPLLTATANDDGYHAVFHRPIELWADAHDLLIAVSSSGESENVVKAATAARAKGCRLVTMTGFSPTNRLRQVGDVNVYVPAATYGYVETAHALIAHCVTDIAMLRAGAATVRLDDAVFETPS
jgi:D-sedoheptulose 7-phosphate isomerase